MKYVSEVDLTESGQQKFSEFFTKFAKSNVRKDVVEIELLNILHDRVAMEESLSYELGRNYTVTGNPEILILEEDDIEVAFEDEA